LPLCPLTKGSKSYAARSSFIPDERRPKLSWRPPMPRPDWSRPLPRSLIISTIMGWPSTRNIRSLVSTMLVVLLSLTSIIAAAETNVCRVSANPSGFDHQQLTLEGIVAGLRKSTSRSGRKDMTFILRSPAGCGGVIVYAQEPATLSNGDHLQVEGIFETQHHRDGLTFYNEMQATKITTLPR
jgi:hypothetical protein